MEHGFKLAFSIVGDFLKILVVTMFIYIALSYVSLYILSYKMMSEAEMDGGFSSSKWALMKSDLIADPSTIGVETSDTFPNFDNRVDMLGQPLKLVIYQEIDLPFLGDTRKFRVTVERTGINQGYYGSMGYGSYGGID